ncbi:hypothetical protein Zmor_024133 [Zophobas morio]|uniref:BTB domain-containing protein n=2 Tax=Zophobas morio TaxID=2755281 RepID=A0AA38HZQ9_9CUCU|nr:hypothetical protein Zmor_024133 [Zophobas morio]
MTGCNSNIHGHIASLYLNEKYSDVVLIANEKRLPAHKAVLAVRSEYFDKLLFGGLQESSQKEIQLNDASSSEAFELFLEYMYTDSISIAPKNIDLSLEVLILAHKYCMEDLQNTLIIKLVEAVDLDKIATILNISNMYRFNVLKEACLMFLDSNALDFLRNFDVSELSQESIIEILKRDTFYAPETELFKTVVKWRERNKDVGDSVLKCIRLPWISAQDLMSVVWPTGLVENDVLLKAVAQSLCVKPKEVPSRGRRILDSNVAREEDKAEVLTNHKSRLLSAIEPRDCERQKIDQGIVIKLGVPSFINSIRMRLYSNHDEYYSYYVEVTIDGRNWKKIIDYTGYVCRDTQFLCFEGQVVQYIKVVGKYSNVNELCLVSFEATYLSQGPLVIGGLIRPNSNIAIEKLGATVIEGNHGEHLLWCGEKDLDYRDGYAYHLIGTDTEGIVIQLNQPYIISSMILLLYDLDFIVYRYFVETSVDNENWELLFDRRDEDHQSGEIITFDERPVVFIRIKGTYSSAEDDQFRIFHFECPAMVKVKTAWPEEILED